MCRQHTARDHAIETPGESFKRKYVLERIYPVRFTVTHVIHVSGESALREAHPTPFCETRRVVKWFIDVGQISMP
jgi:hypothetical protein